MEKNREEMSPRELLERIQKDLDALVSNAFLFGRGVELDIIETAKKISFVAGVVEQELLLAQDSEQNTDI